MSCLPSNSRVGSLKGDCCVFTMFNVLLATIYPAVLLFRFVILVEELVEKSKVARAVVQPRALVQRINKILLQSDRKLVKSKAKLIKAGVGVWTVVDMATDTVVGYHHTLDELAAETGTLRPFEKIAQEAD